MISTDSGFADARVTSKYREGVRGAWTPHPAGGMHQPVIRAPGWEQVGHVPMPAGYVRARTKKPKLR